jgi:GT2 family glycosyltransferase
VSVEAASAGMSASRFTSGRGHVYIVVLNWNGWRDTIECLESLFRLDYPDYTVVVCDNASSDDSWQRIQSWARGEITASCANSELGHLTSPPVTKPVPFVSYSSPFASVTAPMSDCSLALIQTGSNLGFAGGCNVGLRYALAQSNCEYAWLLNNDTIVERDALSSLVEEMNRRPRLGICGSVLVDYSSPKVVQVLGGRRYTPWSGRVLPHGKLSLSELPPSQPIDYVHGASMLVSREFLESVGLMEESYFLYFEELDWSMRAGGRFLLGYSPLSFVYHKEGMSIGTGSTLRNSSLLVERFAVRNRLLLTRRFHPAFVPSVLGWVVLTFFSRLLTGDIRKARQIAAAAWEGLTCPKLPSREL